MLAAFFFSSFANHKNKASISLIKLHAEMERRAENLYSPNSLLSHAMKGNTQFCAYFPAQVIGGDSALRFLALGIPSTHCTANAARTLTYL